MGLVYTGQRTDPKPARRSRRSINRPANAERTMDTTPAARTKSPAATTDEHISSSTTRLPRESDRGTRQAQGMQLLQRAPRQFEEQETVEGKAF